MATFPTPADTAFTLSRTLPVTTPAVPADATRRRAAAVEFTAVFLSEMLSPVFASLSTAAPFGGGAAEEVWRGQLVQDYARSIARQGGFGLADAVEREMIRIQEALG